MYSDPGVQSDCVSTPKLYCLRCSGSVIACHSRSGVVLMKTSKTAVPPATGAVPLAQETVVLVMMVVETLYHHVTADDAISDDEIVDTLVAVAVRAVYGPE